MSGYSLTPLCCAWVMLSIPIHHGGAKYLVAVLNLRNKTSFPWGSQWHWPLSSTFQQQLVPLSCTSPPLTCTHGGLAAPVGRGMAKLEQRPHSRSCCGGRGGGGGDGLVDQWIIRTKPAVSLCAVSGCVVLDVTFWFCKANTSCVGVVAWGHLLICQVNSSGSRA